MNTAVKVNITMQKSKPRAGKAPSTLPARPHGDAEEGMQAITMATEQP